MLLVRNEGKWKDLHLMIFDPEWGNETRGKMKISLENTNQERPEDATNWQIEKNKNEKRECRAKMIRKLDWLKMGCDKPNYKNKTTCVQ